MTGCNHIIKTGMKRYSHHLQELDDSQDSDFAQAKRDITTVLSHNILLMEACSYTMKHNAYKKKEREMLTNGLKRQIEEIQDSIKEEDVTKLEMLKKCLQHLIDHEDNDATMKMLAKHHLEG